MLEQPLIAKIAQAHKKSPAQIVLRWGVQRGCSVITKSSKLERIAEGKDILNFELTAEEVRAFFLLSYLNYCMSTYILIIFHFIRFADDCDHRFES